MNNRWEQLDPGDWQHFAKHRQLASTGQVAVRLGILRALWRDWCLSGAVGLIGLLALGWAPTAAAMLLLASFWLGWLIDAAQRAVHSPALARAAIAEDDARRFWQIVSFLRGTRRRLPDAPFGGASLLGIVVDLVSGVAATALMFRGFAASGIDPIVELTSSGVLIGFGVIAIFGILPTLPARFRTDADGAVLPALFHVGQRGLGLLVAVFALMAVGGGRLGGSLLVGSVYAFYLAMGAIELLIGVPRLRDEAQWMQRQEQLAFTRADDDVATSG